jgi:hypothetical protein
MNRFGTFRTVLQPLRAVLAVVFLLMSALQPGLFASAGAAGLNPDAALSFENARHAESVVLVSHHAGADHYSDPDLTEIASDVAESTTDHHGNAKSTEKSCEVHCAPAHAVPVVCQDIERSAVRCFAPIAADRILSGEYASLIRPPRI